MAVLLLSSAVWRTSYSTNLPEGEWTPSYSARPISPVTVVADISCWVQQPLQHAVNLWKMKTDKTNVVYVSNGWVKQFFDSQKEANNLLVPHWADLHNYSKNTVRKSYTNKLAKSKRKCQKCDPFFLKHFNSSCFKWNSNEISYSERVMSAIPLFSACVCSSFVLDESPPFYPPPPKPPLCLSDLSVVVWTL